MWALNERAIERVLEPLANHVASQKSRKRLETVSADPSDTETSGCAIQLAVSNALLAPSGTLI